MSSGAYPPARRSKMMGQMLARDQQPASGSGSEDVGVLAFWLHWHEARSGRTRLNFPSSQLRSGPRCGAWLGASRHGDPPTRHGLETLPNGFCPATGNSPITPHSQPRAGPRLRVQQESWIDCATARATSTSTPFKVSTQAGLPIHDSSLITSAIGKNQASFAGQSIRLPHRLHSTPHQARGRALSAGIRIIQLE